MCEGIRVLLITGGLCLGLLSTTHGLRAEDTTIAPDFEIIVSLSKNLREKTSDAYQEQITSNGIANRKQCFFGIGETIHVEIKNVTPEAKTLYRGALGVTETIIPGTTNNTAIKNETIPFYGNRTVLLSEIPIKNGNTIEMRPNESFTFEHAFEPPGPGSYDIGIIYNPQHIERNNFEIGKDSIQFKKDQVLAFDVIANETSANECVRKITSLICNNEEMNAKTTIDIHYPHAALRALRYDAALPLYKEIAHNNKISVVEQNLAIREIERIERSTTSGAKTLDSAEPSSEAGVFEKRTDQSGVAEDGDAGQNAGQD